MTLMKTLLVCSPITKIPLSGEIVPVMCDINHSYFKETLYYFRAGVASVEPDLKNSLVILRN